MKSLSKMRNDVEMSQRNLAEKADISFRSLQLIEGGHHDPKLSTVEAIASALGFPTNIVHEQVSAIFSEPPDSIAMISIHIAHEGEVSWKIWLFNFVDAFRARRDERYITHSPCEDVSPKIRALLAATVETLCDELEIVHPCWCAAFGTLQKPWFVAEVENLKAMALVESPIHFRKRNIFVLENFLERQ